jgi:hypothetical protein
MTGNDSLQCGCEGTRHRVCVELSPVLRDPWREAAPWLADYDAGLGARLWRRWSDGQRPNTPNHKIRRAAAARLGVAVRGPMVHRATGSTDCGCRGRRHLVCLKAPKWNALVKAIYPIEASNHCDACYQSRQYRRLLRHEHDRACRVRTLAQRYGDSTRERVQTRIRRLWLGVLREAWA